MNKKDRIAVVISLCVLVIGAMLSTSRTILLLIGWLFILSIPIYWSYRFIKNDLSFIKFKDD